MIFTQVYLGKSKPWEQYEVNYSQKSITDTDDSLTEASEISDFDILPTSSGLIKTESICISEPNESSLLSEMKYDNDIDNLASKKELSIDDFNILSTSSTNNRNGDINRNKKSDLIKTGPNCISESIKSRLVTERQYDNDVDNNTGQKELSIEERKLALAEKKLLFKERKLKSVERIKIYKINSREKLKLLEMEMHERLALEELKLKYK